LIRKDAASIISSLSNLPVQLNITTNGIRIHHFIEILKSSGIHSVNISLDTLQSDKFSLITRRNLFQQVWNNIQLLLLNGFHVKVNVVVMKGLNDNEINDFIAWTKNTPVHVRFIEFMPFSGNRWSSDKVLTLEQILHTISQQYDFFPLQKDAHDTAKKFIVRGHAGTFAVISTMSSHFCGDCNRMRLTADGKLKNCLFSKGETDLLSALRRGEPVTELIHQNIRSKHKQLGGQFTQDYERLHPEEVLNRSMITIGG
jgi:GTP 3',8-cyclase